MTEFYYTKAKERKEDIDNMNIVICCKFVPCPQDIEKNIDGSVSFDRATWEISEFDLQAVEAGMVLAKATGGKLIAVSVGSSRIEASQLKKDLLSRGPDELYLVSDDELTDADTGVISTILAKAAEKIGADIVICGEGSADYYYQQTGCQIGERLGWATLNYIDSIEAGDGFLKVERTLESKIEVLEVPLPAVLSVTTNINTPPRPNMRAILSASKKPVTMLSLSDLGITSIAENVKVVSTIAPRSVDRKNIVVSGDTMEVAAAEFVRCLKVDGVL